MTNGEHKFRTGVIFMGGGGCTSECSCGWWSTTVYWGIVDSRDAWERHVKEEAEMLSD